MGKMRFKLSHVMPHAWFYKLKEVGKPGRSLTFKAAEPRKSAYASPINHKAIDIPFPADTPKKSSLIESEDFTSLDQLHLGELSDECRPSIVLPHTSARRLDEKIMRFSLDADDPHGLSSAPDVKADATSCAVNFDVRELERRLKALGSEDRRKYYTSPMLLSVAVPSPMVNDGINLGMVRTHDGGLHAQEPSLDMCASALSLDAFGSKNRERSPSMNADAYADDERPFEGCVSNGDGLCRSIDESNRHSTSSSDTGFERGSSSMWERDVFSITSDGSEAFTTTCADDVELMHKSRQRFRRLRERMSPSLYATGHMDNGLSRFYDDHQEAGLVENDMISGFFKDGHAADDVQDESDHVPHVCDRDISVQDVADDASGRGLYVRDSSTCVDESSKYNSHERLLIPSPRKSLNFSKGSMRRATQCLLDYEDMSDSFSMQYDRNELLSAQYNSNDDRLSESTRKSSSEFSYARCKERLLSNRTSNGQSRDWVMREAEKEKLPNYTKFKLKQRSFAHSNSSGDIYLDPGLYNNVSRGKQSYAYDNIDSTDMDSMASTSTIPSTFERHNESVQLHRSRTAIYHIKSPHHQAKGLAGQVRSKITMQDKGPSWFKGTLRAVREKTGDPRFEQFSPSTSGGGTTPTRGECSRVFDSFAMVKSSYDPKHDFKESMVEMIMEKDLHTSHDMVELLQCYLTLNADAYHDTIVKVFTEVWSEMFQHI